MSSVRSVSKPAKEGGKPTRATWLPYGRQTIDDDDVAAVTKVLKSDMITRGPAVEAFEKSVAEFSGMPYAVAFTSATAALHAVMSLLGVKAGVKVVTTPNTFAATTNSVLYCGGQPVFKDIHPATMNLDANQLTDLENAKVVVSVDFAGNPCDYKKLLELQKRHGFRLVNDASHSLGASYEGKPVGKWADISIFSFHPVKSITTGEGGMVVTRDNAEAEYLRKFRGHGIVRTETPWFYRQEFLGYNYHMTDIQAALGLSQLKKLPKWVNRREELAYRYTEFFKKFSSLDTPVTTANARSAWHLYPLRLRLDKLEVSRDQFMQALHAENIGANVHYIPVYWHPHYQNLGFKKGSCPIAEHEYLREISLPLFPTMSDDDLKDVCTAVEKILEAYTTT